MNIEEAAEDLRAKELQKRTQECVARLRPILDECGFNLSSELIYSNQGVSSRPVLIPKKDEGITLKTQEKVTV